jgi:type I restriction enzyme S subunit
MKIKLESFLQEVNDKTTENNQYPVLTSSKAGLFLQSDYFNKQVASKDNTGYKIIKKGQFTYRAMSDTGEFFPNMLECTDIGIVSPAYPVFEIINPVIIPEYLKYYFKSKGFQQSISAYVQGSTRTSVKFVKLKTVSMNLPSLEEQKRTIEILDITQNIIEGYKQEIDKLDDLIRARFVEMFGTLHDNENGFDVVTINDVCTMIKDGTHQTPQYTENKIDGYKFLSSKDVMSQKIDWTDIKYIPVELHEKLYATIKPQRNDILMSKNGVNYGVAAVNDTDEVFDIYVSLALLRPKKVIDPVFFRCVINNPETKRQFDSSIKGIGVPNLHLGEIKKTRIILPPMELQREFVAFVEQVDKSKLVEATTIIPKGGFLQWR